MGNGCLEVSVIIASYWHCKISYIKNIQMWGDTNSYKACSIDANLTDVHEKSDFAW